jgi:hypothetical protein
LSRVTFTGFTGVVQTRVTHEARDDAAQTDSARLRATQKTAGFEPRPARAFTNRFLNDWTWPPTAYP